MEKQTGRTVRRFTAEARYQIYPTLFNLIELIIQMNIEPSKKAAMIEAAFND